MTLEDTAHEHNPTIPTSEQWNRDIQDNVVQTMCIGKCPPEAGYRATCRTLSAMLLAQQAHRTTWPRDGPLYVNREGRIKCSILDGYCEIQLKSAGL